MRYLLSAIGIARLAAMIFFRTANQPILLAWTFVLTLAIFSVQGITLHVHSLDHNHHHNHPSIDTLDTHSHLSEAHLSFDSSHADHHDELSSEIDACPDCIFKQASSPILAVALLAMLVILLPPALNRAPFPRDRDKARPAWCYHVFPPLRAPPL